MQVNVAMIGTGYVGLVSGTCFAEFGARVTCVDLDAGKIERLRNGEIPIYEPGLDALVQKNVAAGRLAFTTDLAAAVGQADAVFIGVGTPSRKGDGFPDLSYVEAATRSVAKALDGYTVVVTKSTVPVGTGRWLEAVIKEERPDADFDVASNPEFLREGSAIHDFLQPDRVIVGTTTVRAQELLKALYRPLQQQQTPILVTSLETAELIKYAANAFLATKVTFINEMADLCEKVGADVEVLAKGLGLDKRIGDRFLRAGPGFGGSCFPKDTRALAAIAASAGAPSRLVESVIDVNEQRKAAMADRIATILGGSVEGCAIAVLGVTFKADTDDMREAPSLDILPRLHAGGASLRAFDPAGRATAEPLLPGVSWHDDAYSAIEGADALVILTEWQQFRELDLTVVKALLKRPLVVDLRNIYATEAVTAAGLDYHAIGRPASRPNADAGETRLAAQ